MLSFFKSNNPGVVIFYFLYLALFRACFLFTAPDAEIVFQHHEPLSRILFKLLKNLPFNFQHVSLVLSSVLCFVQAVLINYIVNENKILAKKNHIAGALFIIFFSLFPQSLLLTPSVIALTFLVICTGKIFSLVKKEKSYGDVFDIGFLVSVATLFYFPSILFIIFAYIGLATVRAFSYREWMITIMGFLSPLLLVFTLYYWKDNLPALGPDMLSSHAPGWLHGLNSFKGTDYMILGFLLLFILAALALLPTVLYSTLIQVRKFATTLILFIFLVVISFSLQQTVNLGHFVLMSLPLAIIVSMEMFQIKSKLVSEVIHLILILLVLTGQYFPYFNL